MRAVVLEAEWAPRDADALCAAAERRRRWAFDANRAWRRPRLGLRTLPDPTPGPGDVIVRVEACGICGSDLHMLEVDEAGYMRLPYHVACPVVPGHEVAGVVQEVGAEVDDVRPGDLVAVEEIQYCGACLACRGGYPNSCERIEDVGFTIDGGFAELVRVPRKALWPLDALLERYGSAERVLEVGALCEPVSVAYEGMFTRAGGVRPGGTVVVFGAGPIGLAAVALGAAAGAGAVLCVETVPERRALARTLGATEAIDPASEDPLAAVARLSRGMGAALAVEASGSFADVLPTVERGLAVGGKVAVLGMNPERARIDLGHYQLRAGSIHGSVGHAGSWSFPYVINLMASGRIDMEPAITRRVALSAAPDAVRALADRTEGKVLVKPGLPDEPHAWVDR